MNGLDLAVLKALNGCMHKSPWLDAVIITFTRNNLLKGGFFMAIAWTLWFVPARDQLRARASLIATMFGAMCSVALGRALAAVLPLRVRPTERPDLHLLLPFNSHVGELRGWSSFPSDHAMMYFELAFGITFLSPGVGLLLMVYTTIVICIPRIMIGLHFPSDVLGGALIGIGTAWIVQRRAIVDLVRAKLVPWSELRPGLFYGAMFLLMYQLADMFSDLRSLAQAIRGH